MQQLNNDMDDLFRKAAENYPLRTGVPDWDKVAAGLQQEEKDRPVVLPFYRRYLLLIVVGTILLFGTGMYKIAMHYSSADDQNDSRITHTPDGASRLNKSAIPDSSDLQRATLAGVTGDSAPQEIRAVNKTGKEAATSALHVSASIIKSPFKLPAHKPSSTSSGITGNNAKGSLSPGNPLNSDTTLIIIPAEMARHYDVTSLRTSIPENGLSALEDPAPYTSLPHVNRVAPGDIAAPPAESRSFSAVPVLIKKSFPEKRIYAGIAGGIDFTSVSLQRIAKPGFHYGVVAGYRLSKRFSIETGFFIEMKDYYTSAKHFDRSRLYINPNSKILSIDGVCHMYEIPVAIKFDISNTYRSGWFVTGGLSSYFMKKEDYSMKYYYNSSGTTAK
ncbi:MAG: hypothetical protein EOO04_19395, partial [Chitinophagaceae bacterium]